MTTTDRIVDLALIGIVFLQIRGRRLSPPQLLVLVALSALIAQGLSNGGIASRLYVAEATVKTHVNRIFAKTQSRDRAQAAAYARAHGLEV